MNSKENKAEFERFKSSPLGQKFEKSYVEDVDKFFEVERDKLYNKKTGEDKLRAFNSAELNDFFNQYVKDNYKK